MSWLTSITNLFSSNNKVTNDIFDKNNGHLAKFGEWIGNMNFTEEERSEVTREMIKTANKFVVDTIGENTERSKARRSISEKVIRLWLSLFTLDAAIFTGGLLVWPINKEWSQVFFMVAEQLFKIPTSGALISIVGAITMFFYGTHMLRASPYGNDKGK